MCGQPLSDQNRLRALSETRLLDSEAEEAFDRISQLARRFLGAPVCLVSLVTEKRQFFKSALGLPEPFATQRQTPISHSFCQHVVTTGAPLIVNDAPNHPLVRGNPAIRDLGVMAYLGIPLHSPDGHVIGSFCVIDSKPRAWSEEEIITLKELCRLVVTEIKLRTVDARQRRRDFHIATLTNAAPIGIFHTDPEGHCSFVNKRWCEISGLTPEQAQGTGWAHAIHPDDRALVYQTWEKAAKAQKPFYLQYRFQRPDGKITWVVGRSNTETDTDGTIIGHIGTIEDINTLKTTETRLRDALDQVGHQQYSIDQHAIVAVTDVNGTITYANSKFCEISGYADHELIGQNHRLLKSGHHAPAFYADLYATITEGKTWHGEICNRAKDGHLYWVDTTIVPFIGPDKKPVRYISIRTDITAQKEATKKIERLGALQRAILSASNSLIISTDTEGIVTSFNHAAENALGYSSAEIVGKTTPALWHDSAEVAQRAAHLTRELGRPVAPGFETFTAKAIATARPDENEWTLIRKDGSRFPAALSATSLHDDTGAVTGFLGILQDITERKKAEALEHAFSDRIRKLAANIPGFLYQFLLRPDGTSCFPYASEGIAIIYRVTPEEVREDAAKAFAVLHPDDLKAIESSIQSSAQTLAPWRLDYRVRHLDGTIRWLRGESQPAAQPDGSILWHGYISDITEQKAAEATYRETNERLRLSFIHAGIGKALLTRDGHWLEANPALLDMLGYPLEELKKFTFQDLTHPEDLHLGQALVPRLESGEIPVIKIEKRYRRADGTYLWCKLTAVVVRDEHNRPLCHIAQLENIDALKQAAEEKTRIELKLNETAKLESLGVLAGGIAHDFNNLLTGVLGNAAILRMDLPSSSQLLPTIEQIEIASRRAAELCRQMLAYSGKGRFVIRKIDLNTVVHETTRLLEISISKHAILRYHLAPTLPPVEADETQLRQVIMNLVINASEAIGERSGVIAITTGICRVDTDYLATLRFDQNVPPGDYVSLEISDTGQGMDEATLKKIFDPFFSTKFTGRGLGLAAVQGIIRGHRGGMKVYSEPGKGTTFRILLPCADGKADSIDPFNADDIPHWKGQGTVLVVDDEETVRNVAARLLEKIGFTVERANDGAAAMELFRRHPTKYALVLLDLTMPHLDGEETFRQMRHLYPAARVVLMSGFNHQEIMTRFSGKGLAGFVQKPIEAQILLDEVRRACLTT